MAPLQDAIRIEPTDSEPRLESRFVRVALGQGEAVLHEWKSQPPSQFYVPDDWFNYAELCLLLGQEEEYRRAAANCWPACRTRPVPASP